jgi:hypothetical protein
MAAGPSGIFFSGGYFQTYQSLVMSGIERSFVNKKISYLFLGFLFAPATPFEFPRSFIGWTINAPAVPTSTTSARPLFVVGTILRRALFGGTIELEAFA